MISSRNALRLQTTLYVVTLLLFAASLFLPVVVTVEANHGSPHTTDQWIGWWFLFFGPLGVSKGQLGWFANPLMLLSAMPMPPHLKLIFAGLAVALAVSSLAITSMHVVDAELVVTSARSGFYLWLACPFLLLFGALVGPDGEIIGTGRGQAV
ncbi:hypothetical protein QA635_06620 [Bradyrhizobium brasilense]|uniref:hypothetical protein n=1 Tax=Bradyrhizobium brasilense TaxID=1419277 RepID=UPI0024B15880|nr:hypothetical protein [Bradyrhizobium australafricanum]WFU34108.1 hypothetical protein QA635_06620 [Bradyrhizobium australafricanum]